jgi:hypothetical protein
MNKKADRTVNVKNADRTVIVTAAGVIVSIFTLGFSIFQYSHSRDIDARLKEAQLEQSKMQLEQSRLETDLKKRQADFEARSASERALAELGRRVERSLGRLRWVKQLRWTDESKSPDEYRIQRVMYIGSHIAAIVDELDKGDDAALDLRSAPFNELVIRIPGDQRAVDLKAAYTQLSAIRSSAQKPLTETDVQPFLRRLEPILEQIKMESLGLEINRAAS